MRDLRTDNNNYSRISPSCCSTDGREPKYTASYLLDPISWPSPPIEGEPTIKRAHRGCYGGHARPPSVSAPATGDQQPSSFRSRTYAIAKTGQHRTHQTPKCAHTRTNTLKYTYSKIISHANNNANVKFVQLLVPGRLARTRTHDAHPLISQRTIFSPFSVYAAPCINRSRVAAAFHPIHRSAREPPTSESW